MTSTQVHPTLWQGSLHFFVDDISTSLQCPIHKGLFSKAVIASCGHTFCHECICEYVDQTEEPECPIDHSTLKGRDFLIPNLAVEGQIKELVVYCKYSLRTVDSVTSVDPTACNRKVTLSNYLQHEAECGFALTSCPNCKKDNIHRKDLEEHKSTCDCCPCPFASAGCQFFGKDVELEKHMKECQYEKIKEFIVKSQEQWKEMKNFMKRKEEEASHTQESLQIIKKQLEQVIMTMDVQNKRTEGALMFIRDSIDELTLQVSTNCDDIATLQSTNTTARRIPSMQAIESKGDLLGTFKNNAGGGHVPGVPGLNITHHASFTGHTGPVWALAATESLLISGSSDSTVKIWELSSVSSPCKLTLTGHEGIVHAVAVNGRHVLSGSSDKLIKVWDIDSGKCLKTLTQHENTVCSLFIGGGYIFSGSFNEVKVWNTQTYKVENTLRGYNHWVRAIAIHEKTLYCGSYNLIKVWDLENFQCTGTITAQCGSIYSLAFAGNRLLAGTFENLIYVWERETFRSVATLHGHFGAVYNLCVIKDRLYSASYDTSIRVWSLDTLRCIQTIGHHNSSVEALIQWGGMLFSGSADATIKVWR